jgi:hypothetical protein
LVDRAKAIVAARNFRQKWKTLDELPYRVIQGCQKVVSIPPVLIVA